MGKFDSDYVKKLLESGKQLPRPWANVDPQHITKIECGSCHACCHQIAVLTENDDPFKYRTEILTTVQGERIRILKRNEDGSCTYLGSDGCTIYGEHPEVCRSFHCGELWKMLPNRYKIEMRKKGDDQDRLMLQSGKKNARSK
jgi:Fe-S-cluster containining protein